MTKPNSVETAYMRELARNFRVNPNRLARIVEDPMFEVAATAQLASAKVAARDSSVYESATRMMDWMSAFIAELPVVRELEASKEELDAGYFYIKDAIKRRRTDGN